MYMISDQKMVGMLGMRSCPPDGHQSTVYADYMGGIVCVSDWEWWMGVALNWYGRLARML